MEIPFSSNFPPYTQYHPQVPIWCVTPRVRGCLHRGVDSSPISPSGRYLALTRLIAEHRLPALDERADILVIDLYEGRSHMVALSAAYDTVMGAQLQWGQTDHELYFNDLDTKTWQVHGVRLDPITGERRVLGGPIYALSPDGKRSASPCLLRLGLTQVGLGAMVPPYALPLNEGASGLDGVYLTYTETGKSRLEISFRDMLDILQPAIPWGRHTGGAFYGGHMAWNPQGTRLLMVLRFRPNEARPLIAEYVVTLEIGGRTREAYQTISCEQWQRGGQHPRWCPDGEHILMNLNLHGTGLRLVRVKYDGTGLEELAPKITGSGLPTLHPDGRHVLTDVQMHEPMGFVDGSVPLRWIDLERKTETTLARVKVRPPYIGPNNMLALQPAPALDRTHKYAIFNACPEGHRQVFLMDLRPMLGR
jgi:hypothetical protein